jgi:hypothetical protein
MIAIKRLAVAAVLGCVAVAASGQFASPASAGPDKATFTIAFDYDAAQSAEHNYRAFQREARRACTTPGVRLLSVRKLEDTCIAQAVDAFVQKLGRTDVAAIHFDRTGRRIDSSRILAAR